MTEKQKQLRLKQQITAIFSIQKLIHKQRKYHFENSNGVDHIKSKKCSLTIVTLYGDLARKKTQLLHRIRLRKFTPQASLADVFVREADCEKDDQMPIANDDLYAQSWNTNFGPNPFDDSPSDFLQNTEDTEYIPIQLPENSRPPSPESSKKVGGAQWNRPLYQIKIRKIMLMKVHNN